MVIFPSRCDLSDFLYPRVSSRLDFRLSLDPPRGRTVGSFTEQRLVLDATTAKERTKSREKQLSSNLVLETRRSRSIIRNCLLMFLLVSGAQALIYLRYSFS